ncbi:MAG: transcription-repair coupling factor [Crocinitomicaceae bacterium]|nr:transcription-repair coupling factor [Crocinitomicaceae bacterium]
MTPGDLVQQISQTSQIAETLEILKYSEKKIAWERMVGSANALYAYATLIQVPGNHIFILEDKEAAAYFMNDLEAISEGDKRIIFFPDSYKNLYELDETENYNVVQRAETLERLSREQNLVVVTYSNAIFEKVVTQKQLSENVFEVQKGKEYSIDFLNELLLEYHFEKVDFVYEPGQFSVRGGIVDIYSFSNDYPFRIEFFGDEVESIRTFDTVSQLSVANHAKFVIVPNVQNKILLKQRESFLEFISDQSTLWTIDSKMVLGKLKKLYKEAQTVFANLPDTGISHLPPNEMYLYYKDFEKLLDKFNVLEIGKHGSFQADQSIVFSQKPQPSFNKNFELLNQDLLAHKANGYQNIIVSNQPKQIERLYAIFEDIGAKDEFTTLNFALSHGFVDENLQTLIYTDHQLFERYNRFRLKEGYSKNKQAITLKEIKNLQKGDFVTHIDHGVGRFSGLETIDVNGKPQEAVRLIYKDDDVLYVSIHSLHRISKFTGKEGVAPKMNKLGSPQWSNLKKKTKTRIKELAFDLIKLYAKRKSNPGFAFAPDTYLQTELEASFIYEDTPDQLKATNAVKEDMESPAPMDRLVCGDVGFGKTEVAIRAAFKAATDGKQVAVLVPTTILSIQHYRSFKERLAEFPVTVSYLNRFKSQKQVTDTLKQLSEGKIDILIGTHKIVGKNVKFKDLGLLIIDEEQKFGVSVKDRLKTMRETIDTLTLTATPIPRTLQFSLMGARDLSIINTPPPNRQPVLTELLQFNEEKIRDAIGYEISRGGQVYFVHNKIQNIEEIANLILKLVPGTRIAVGHGQMEGAKLERLMMGFIEHEYDVLIATTIIESGIDIPNANTIIINDAQNFGLSDLHQLRGRVGRSNKKAFCYLLSPRLNTLSTEARKRLEAIVQFSDIGSGFNIAMRDLDIRGAGNLLGGEQSGFMADIGIEMYQKLLSEAVEELREEEFKDFFADKNKIQETDFVKECILETDLELLLPDTYVNNIAERLSLYQELDNLESEDEINSFKEKLEDRFGELPEQAVEMTESIRLRLLAKNIGFEKLVLKNEKMIGYFIQNEKSPYYQSPVFTSVLNYVQARSFNVNMSEKNNKLRLIYTNISSIAKALEVLKPIISNHV